MSRKSKIEARIASGYVEVKSKFEAEFRRFALRINPLKLPLFEEFSETVRQVHSLKSLQFTITYTDPEGDLLPINNDDNFAKALSTARPLLRLLIQRKGQSEFEINGYGTAQRKRNVISKLIPGESKPRHVAIGLPEDFRQVSAIIDVDILPETQRRVKLMRKDSGKPLGFYIRDGTSVRVTPQGLEKVQGIFISRLAQGGLAESTGLLAVNDEVLEVNGIEVVGKTLDQVTDMMVANSGNLIITIIPVNQHSSSSASSTMQSNSMASLPATEPVREDDEDEIAEYVVPGNDDSETPILNNQSETTESCDPVDSSNAGIVNLSSDLL